MGIEIAHERTRSEGGLEELYVRHAPGALRLAYFLTGDPELAEDLVQDAFVKLTGRFRHLRMPEAFEAYLRRTIVNLFTSHLRRLRLERMHAVRQAGPVDPAGTEVDLGERDRMWRALRSLPARQRAAIVLRYYEDLSERETAEVLGCSASAANALIARGMSALRVALGGEER